MAKPAQETPFAAKDVFLYRAPLAPQAPGLPLPSSESPRDPAACTGLLASVHSDDVLSEALALASPSLSALIRRVRERGTAGIKAGQLRRAALAVLRYDIRMRTRPTPFGLFAGVATGRFDSAAKAERGMAHRTRTHVDMQWLTRIGQRLECDPAVLSALTVQAHQALVPRGDRLVLTSPSTRGVRLPESGEGRSTVSVRGTPVVKRAVAEAVVPLPFEDLVRRTGTAFPGAPVERIRQLLAELVRQEILITGLRPPLDGGDPLSHVLGLLATVNDPSEETHRIHDGLLAVRNQRQAYDAQNIGAGRACLGRLLSTARTVEPDDTPLHIDTRIDATLHLPHEVREEIEQALDVMWRLSRPKLGLFALRDYHRRFLDAYGVDRAVPVLELLDEARGLGAPAGYGWPNSEAAPVPSDEPRTARRDRAMARLAATAQRTGQREAVLHGTDLDELCHDTADRMDLPNSCEVTVQVVAPSLEALDDGEFRVFLSPSPGSHRAGSTFARFADQHPHWRAEFAALHRDTPVHIQGAIPVDLAFMPRSGRAANLAHTVPATGRRISVGVPRARGAEELSLGDIGVGATLDRLTAICLSTGREIVPVLGNMVSAPAQAPNAVRLLWEIGLEGQRLWEPWNWGPWSDAPFVPRVRYGRFVLACAVWRLDEIRAWAERHRTQADGPAWDTAVAKWRSAWDVPHRVLAVTADQRLLLDLDQTWHRAVLFDLVLRHRDLVVQEVPGEYEGWLESPLAGHTSELVVPLVRRESGTPRRRPYTGRSRAGHTTYGLGGEWLYLKLRGPVRTQDDLLRDHVPGLIDLTARKGADGWFFIRYTDDGGHHLRLRLHGACRKELWGEVAPEAGAVLVQWQREGLLRGHSVAQYEPETERYGGAAAQASAERVFQYDSEAAVELLRLAKDPGNDFQVDDLAAISCAALAHAFGPPVPTGSEAAEHCGDDGAASWLSMTGTRRDLPGEFRARQDHWRHLIDPYGGWPALAEDPTGARALAVLHRRDQAVEQLATVVRQSRQTSQGRVVGSLLHMVCNRLFGGSSARELTVLGIARGAVQDQLNRRRHPS